MNIYFHKYSYLKNTEYYTGSGRRTVEEDEEPKKRRSASENKVESRELSKTLMKLSIVVDW